MSAGGAAGGLAETDIASCFTAIPHEKLMQAVQERVCDQAVLKLLRVMLRAGVMEDGQVRRPVTGTPQGGVLSPLMCNVYLHRLDRAWDEHDGVLVRFADDLVVMCWSRSQAERALECLRALLADLGLEPKAAKTRIVHLEAGGEGFDFLGFHHRLVRSRGDRGKPKVTFLARWPADRAMQHARDRIRELTRRRWLPLRPGAIAQEVNAFLRGWAAYFRYGHSAQRLSKIRQYARMRLALFISKKHRRSRAFGWRVMITSVPGEPGLISLYGIVVAPRAGKPWRDKPNAGGERRR
jgi:RNA-directed DNA polymerase